MWSLSAGQQGIMGNEPSLIPETPLPQPVLFYNIAC